EDLRHAAGGADALVSLAGEPVEVGVARRDVAEQRGDADHGAGEVVVEEADGAEHGPVGGASGAFGGQAAAALAVGGHGRSCAAGAGAGCVGGWALGRV